MSADSVAQRILPHLRRMALAQDAESGDGQLLGEFVAGRDEAAFATLVRRHGPMVLGVCRRVIGDAHLAEDAFQATFLVLARRAATVRPRHLVGHWLYGVAYRTALKARGTAARRRHRELQVAAMPQPAISPEDAWSDLQPVLDVELARLPEKYRVPVVLCDLAGRPQRDVARELKVPAATLANRLSAARRLLAKRLSDRGIVLSASAVAAALSWHAATSALPPNLVRVTAKAACAAATGQTATLPPPIVELSDGVMRMFILKKLKAVAATCLIVAAGIGLWAESTLRANPDEKSPQQPSPAKTAAARPVAESEDVQFLRRLSLDLRGMLPTALELTYFVDDKDPQKRDKVTRWMLPEHGNQPVTKMCSTCHAGSVWLNLRDPELSHGFAFAELSDPALSLQLLTEDKTAPELELSRARVTSVRTRLAALRLQERKSWNAPELEEARARVQQAEAELKAAEAHLALEETQARKQAALRGWLSEAKSSEPKEVRTLPLLTESVRRFYAVKRGVTDVEFLRRVSLDIRGVAPTKVEESYFSTDKDPKKHEKLLAILAKTAKSAPGREKFVEELLADPNVQDRWVELWRQRIAEDKQKEARVNAIKKPSDRLTRLVTALLEGKRSDEQILDALCLATMARFATDTERQLILDQVKSLKDRAAAWEGVVRVLAATAEAKAHAEGLAKRVK